MRKTIFAIALMSAMSAMAQKHAEVDVHARYTKVVTPVNGKYESKRPPVAERLFTSEAVEKKIKEVQKLLKKNPKLAWMFANCYPNTLESTVHYRQLANGDDDTFVYTGDIPAMWLRDSGAQVWPYVALANKDEKLKKMLRGVILRQLKCINIDRYANAYNDGPTGAGWQKDDTEMKAEVFERKYEIDSFCYPIRLAYEYWKVTGDDSIFGEDWMQAIGNILKTLEEDGSYGNILRAKGMVAGADGEWIYFDMVPGEHEVRTGAPEYTGRICVIGAEIKEDKLAELFQVK